MVAAVVALGIVGLGVHAAADDHHLEDAGASLCVAAFAVASIPLLAAARRHWGQVPFRTLTVLLRPESAGARPRRVIPRSRAGPARILVLRC